MRPRFFRGRRVGHDYFVWSQRRQLNTLYAATVLQMDNCYEFAWGLHGRRSLCLALCMLAEITDPWVAWQLHDLFSSQWLQHEQRDEWQWFTRHLDTWIESNAEIVLDKKSINLHRGWHRGYQDTKFLN